MPQAERTIYHVKNAGFEQFFCFYDSTNHLVPKTGVSSFTVQWRNIGSSSWTTAATGNVTEIANGLYRITMSAEDGGAGGTWGNIFVIKLTGTGADTVFLHVIHAPVNLFDSIRAGITALPSANSGNFGGLLISGTTQYTVLTNANGNVAVYQNNDKTNYELSSTGLSAVAAAVWNSVMSSFVTAGTFGKKLNDLIVDVWDVSLPGAYGSGKAGRILGLNLDTNVASRSSLDATTVATSVLAALDNPNVEISAPPSATAGLKQMIQFIFAYIKNKRTATSSVETLFKDDSTTPMGTASISDSSGTVTKGKMS